MFYIAKPNVESEPKEITCAKTNFLDRYDVIQVAH